MDYSLPGSSVHGILQARILEWVICPPPGDLSKPGTELTSLTSPALAARIFTTSSTWEAQLYTRHQIFSCVIIPQRTLNISFYSAFIWLCQVLVVSWRIFSCNMVSAVACGIKFPGQELNPGPLHWECSTLAIGLPRNSTPHPNSFKRSWCYSHFTRKEIKYQKR